MLLSVPRLGLTTNLMPKDSVMPLDTTKQKVFSCTAWSKWRIMEFPGCLCCCGYIQGLGLIKLPKVHCTSGTFQTQRQTSVTCQSKQMDLHLVPKLSKVQRCVLCFLFASDFALLFLFELILKGQGTGMSKRATSSFKFQQVPTSESQPSKLLNLPVPTFYLRRT